LNSHASFPPPSLVFFDWLHSLGLVPLFRLSFLFFGLQSITRSFRGPVPSSQFLFSLSPFPPFIVFLPLSLYWLIQTFPFTSFPVFDNRFDRLFQPLPFNFFNLFVVLPPLLGHPPSCNRKSLMGGFVERACCCSTQVKLDLLYSFLFPLSSELFPTTTPLLLC